MLGWVGSLRRVRSPSLIRPLVSSVKQALAYLCRPEAFGLCRKRIASLKVFFVFVICFMVRDVIGE